MNSITLSPEWIIAGLVLFWFLCSLGTRRAAEGLKNSPLVPVSLRDLRGIPKENILEKRQAAERLGVNLLAEYQKANYHDLFRRHYCCSYTDAEKTVSVTVEFYQELTPIMALVSLIMRENCVRKCGITFTTYFEGSIRILSSNFLKHDLWPPSTRANNLPPSTTLEEVYRSHKQKVDEYRKLSNSKPIAISSSNRLFELDQLHSALVADSVLEQKASCKLTQPKRA